MREYKFRGKRLDNGEWVYGAFVPDALEQTHGKMVTWGFIRRYKPDQTGESVEMIKIDRNTVGQYTGLKDKNGTEIYEDDLVAVADYANWEGLYKVAWDNDGSMYVIEDAHGDREKLCEFEEYLVKGNIHDLRNWI